MLVSSAAQLTVGSCRPMQLLSSTPLQKQQPTNNQPTTSRQPTDNQQTTNRQPTDNQQLTDNQPTTNQQSTNSNHNQKHPTSSTFSDSHSHSHSNNHNHTSVATRTATPGGGGSAVAAHRQGPRRPCLVPWTVIGADDVAAWPFSVGVGKRLLLFWAPYTGPLSLKSWGWVVLFTWNHSFYMNFGLGSV